MADPVVSGEPWIRWARAGLVQGSPRRLDPRRAGERDFGAWGHYLGSESLPLVFFLLLLQVAPRRRPDGHPDAVLDGLEATRRLLEGDGDKPKVIVLTTFHLDDYVYEALRAGASAPVPRLSPARFDVLTEREREVLRLIAKGRSNPEIVADLVLSAQTVKTYVGRILAKLALRDRAQAIVLAYETGLVSP